MTPYEYSAEWEVSDSGSIMVGYSNANGQAYIEVQNDEGKCAMMNLITGQLDSDWFDRIFNYIGNLVWVENNGVQKLYDIVQQKYICDVLSGGDRSENGAFFKMTLDGKFHFVTNAGVVNEAVDLESEQYIARSLCAGMFEVRSLKSGSLITIINENGNVIMSGVEDIGSVRFTHDLLEVKKNGKWGLINNEGDFIIPCEYDRISFFDGFNDDHGYSAVKGNTYCRFDYDGKLLASFTADYESYDYVSNCITDNLIIVGNSAEFMENYKKGVINGDGKTVIPIIYRYVSCNYTNPDYDDIIIVSAYIDESRENSEFFYFDLNGEAIVPLGDYECIVGCSNGMYIAEKNNKYGYIDKQGKIIIPFKYDSIGSFSEGLAAVAMDGKCGYINTDGELVIPCKYDSAGSFENGRAYVKTGGQYYSIDKNGRMKAKYSLAGTLTRPNYVYTGGIKINDTDEVIDITDLNIIPRIFGENQDIIVGFSLKENKLYRIDINESQKTQQNIIVNEIGEKTYGDDSFKLDVIPDSESKLSNFTYESNNSNVADISDDGTVTIKSAGETDITVREAGNDDYAPFRKTVKLTVNRKSVSITSVDVGAKTAELSGVLGADTDKVEIDFDKITVELVGDNDENTMKILIKNLELAGDKSKNYSLTQESIESIVSNENVVSIEAEGENGSVTGAAKYIKGSAVTVKAEPENGYSFKGWYIGENEVSTEAEYKFTAENNVKLTAKFEKIPSRRSGSRSTPSYSIRFNANGGSEIGNISVKQGQAIGSVSEPKKDGYKFNGWYYDEELTKPYGSGDKITASSTLYAAWIADPSRAIVLTIGENESVVFGKTVTNDVAPKIVNGRTMLPARFVAEHLGAEVAWDEDERAVKITGKNGDGEAVEIVITIGAKTAIVNGEEIELDSAAFIENDRTYTPVRFITEQLGAKVDWNEETHRVTLIK